MICTACDVLPLSETPPQWVAAFAPASHVLAKARTLAAASGAVLDRLEHDVAVFHFPEGHWTTFLTAFALQTTEQERLSTRFAPLADAQVTGLALARAAFSAPSAETWWARREFGWVANVLAEHRLVSHYQPIVDTRTGSVHAHEALVRAQRPDGSLAPAGQIIEGARRLDLLFALDQQARQSALRHAAPPGSPARRLFINFLPTVIYDPERCLATTWQALKETEYRPEDVVFEVVECEAIANRRDLCSILQHYRAKGFRIALDDLGSGYASINLLGELRPDYVKLDMELVRGAPTDKLRAGLIEGITRVARQFSMEVIAEGVETPEQAQCVKELGVHLMQGYRFARPAPRPAVPADVFTGLLDRSTAATGEYAAVG